MIRNYCIVVFLLLMVIATDTNAQKQLVLLKGEKVILRLYPGDDFVFRLKNSKRVKSSYVNNLNETAVFTHSDTVPFHTIERVYFRQSRFYNRLGGRLIGAGIVLFAFDQFNETVVQGNKASLDKDITLISAIFVGAGIPMVLIRKNSQQLNYKYRLMTVERGSIFYKESPKGFTSPYLPN